MCEMMALITKDKKIGIIHAPFLKALIKQSEYNSDGSGFAYYLPKSVQIFKSGQKATENKEMNALCGKDLDSSLLLAHVRLASVEPYGDRNAHPFWLNHAGKDYTFAHNGDLENYQSIPLSGKIAIKPESDSEQAFYYLMENVLRRGPFEKSEKYFSEVYRDFRYFAGFGRFNCFFSDGNFLFAYADPKGTKHMKIAHVDSSTHLIYMEVIDAVLDSFNARMQEWKKRGDPVSMKLYEATRKRLDNWPQQKYMVPYVENLPSGLVKPGEMHVYLNGELVYSVYSKLD